MGQRDICETKNSYLHIVKTIKKNMFYYVLHILFSSFFPFDRKNPSNMHILQKVHASILKLLAPKRFLPVAMQYVHAYKKLFRFQGKMCVLYGFL